MKKSFIRDLVKEGKLKIVDPSIEISQSYIIKSQNSLMSSKLLYRNNLFEDSISMSYFSMYNLLTSLLFRIGIKSENHNFSIFLLKTIFFREDLFSIISNAKRERINKQYYVDANLSRKSSLEVAKRLILDTEDFNLLIRDLISDLSNSKILELRNKFKALLK
jgi:uncharacterized protein (UPF0332 family)